MAKLSMVQRISFSAIMLAFGIVSTMVFKMIPMGSFSFLRFSLTPSIVLFSSLTLGPFFGAVVGVFSDLVPAFILSQGAYNPFLSLAYLLLGVVPYFLYRFVSKRQKVFSSFWSVLSLFVLFFLLLVLAFYCNPSLDSAFGENGVWLKPLILGITAVLDVALLALLWLLNKTKGKDPLRSEEGENVFTFAFVAGLSEFVLMTTLKSLAFYLFFLINGGGSSPFSYWYLFSMLVLGTAPSSFIDTYFLSFMIPFSKRLFVRK